MTITLELPPELETKLTAEASRQGVPLSDYLLRVLSNGGAAARASFPEPSWLPTGSRPALWAAAPIFVIVSSALATCERPG